MESGTASLYDQDILRIAEELEDMGERERRALVNRTKVLLRHLLMREYQPERRSRNRTATINVQRQRVARLLLDSPSLRMYLGAELPVICRDAATIAAIETGLATIAFPPECPFTLEQIFSHN